ncbi:hypothetical protein GOQ27_08005 [Clostridium sp. D2Q-11]|uniref:Uncharacterized protein n=1 Tax=Anaeromonas frigoriresistens TaxID=2683708 RepID=A0A942UVS6_9FIRM|nr:hypothetical protein [Anaeromonas frigoriresistens]MBS4538405.1 hypothetical protein [Anaeromonas frigoriresistens]
MPGSEEEKLLAYVIFEERNKQPWTIVGIAIRMIHCNMCGSKIGGKKSSLPITKYSR